MADDGDFDDPVELLLFRCGFTAVPHRINIMQEGFDTLESFKLITMKDIDAMAKSFAERTGNRRIEIPIVRLRRLKAMVYWIKDCYRCGQIPDPANFNEDSIQIALQQMEVEKQLMEQAETVSKATSPGKLEDEKKWHDWDIAMNNHLSTILGTNGVPLSYVIRKKELPEQGVEYASHMERMIACAPLAGVHYNADRLRVHQIIKGCVHATPAWEWITHLDRYADGRRDYVALRAHYEGKGTMNRRLADAESMLQKLHYKSERVFSFEKYLTRLQLIFQIYEENGEAYTEAAKVRLLLNRIQHAQLKNAVEAVRLEQARFGEDFTRAADYLAGAVATLPGDSTVINKKDTRFLGQHSASVPQLKTGYHKPDEWNKLPRHVQKKIMKAREKKGKRPSKKPNGGENMVSTGNNKRGISQIAVVEETNSTNAPIVNNAGDAFGGQRSVRPRPSQQS